MFLVPPLGEPACRQAGLGGALEFPKLKSQPVIESSQSIFIGLVQLNIRSVSVTNCRSQSEKMNAVLKMVFGGKCKIE